MQTQLVSQMLYSPLIVMYEKHLHSKLLNIQQPILGIVIYLYSKLTLPHRHILEEVFSEYALKKSGNATQTPANVSTYA